MKNANKLNTDKFKKAIFLMVSVITFAANTAMAQNATASKIAGFYAWLKPIVTAILLILTLVFAGRLLFKMAFQQREAGMDLAWFIVFLAFWGMWAMFASDILSFFGITAVF
jgi:hypothetical protein